MPVYIRHWTGAIWCHREKTGSKRGSMWYVNTAFIQLGRIYTTGASLTDFTGTWYRVSFPTGMWNLEGQSSSGDGCCKCRFLRSFYKKRAQRLAPKSTYATLFLKARTRARQIGCKNNFDTNSPNHFMLQLIIKLDFAFNHYILVDYLLARVRVNEPLVLLGVDK